MNEGFLMLGALFSLVCLLVFFVELRTIANHTKRSAEATERAAAWLEWAAKQRGGGG